MSEVRAVQVDEALGEFKAPRCGCGRAIPTLEDSDYGVKC